MKKHPQNEEVKNIYQDPPLEQLQSIISLYTQGQLQQTLSESSQMLEQFPNSVVLYNISGVSNAGLMQFDAAIDSYKQALKIKPDYAEAYYNMGVALKDKGDLEAAIDSYKQALKIKPDYADAYYNMGNVLKDKGDPEAAIDSYKQALKIKPDYTDAHNNMGVALKDKGDLEAAIDSYKQALKIKPNYADAYNNMGNALRDKGDLEAAIDSYKQALKIKPDYADAYYNIGVTLNDKGDPEAAIESHQQALKIKPNYAESYYNMGIAHLKRGNLDEGFKCHEWRLKMEKRSTAPARTNLIWDGEQSLSGKHFVVYEEQGLGDIIQFCRYLPVLEQKGADVTFKVRSSLHVLLQTMDSKTSLNKSLPEENKIDFESPLMSLPLALKTTVKTIPAQIPYLYADDQRKKRWNEKLGNKAATRIGLVWSGSTWHENDHNRSLLLKPVNKFT